MESVPDWSIDDEVRWRQPAHVLARRVGELGIVLNVEQERYFVLNPTAMRMWEVISEGRSGAAVVTAMQQEYDAPRHIVLRDLHCLLAELERMGFLQRSHEAQC